MGNNKETDPRKITVQNYHKGPDGLPIGGPLVTPRGGKVTVLPPSGVDNGPATDITKFVGRRMGWNTWGSRRTEQDYTGRTSN